MMGRKYKVYVIVYTNEGFILTGAGGGKPSLQNGYKHLPGGTVERWGQKIDQSSPKWGIRGNYEHVIERCNESGVGSIPRDASPTYKDIEFSGVAELAQEMGQSIASDIISDAEFKDIDTYAVNEYLGRYDNVVVYAMTIKVDKRLIARWNGRLVYDGMKPKMNRGRIVDSGFERVEMAHIYDVGTWGQGGDWYKDCVAELKKHHFCPAGD